MKKVNFLYVLITFLIMIILILFPNISIGAVKQSLLMCFNVIIPSLFPFTVLAIFLSKCGFTNFLGKTGIYVLSILSGYPVGAKVINELYKEEKIDKKTATLMLCYCVGSGPAFIVIAVGKGYLGNIKMGFLLLFSHIISSTLMAVVLSFFVKKSPKKKEADNISLSECFVTSTQEASKTILNICAFVVVFSVINSLLIKSNVLIFKKTAYLTEITSAIFNTKNIVLISFLLGFGGICVWFQIISVSKDIGFPLYILTLSRTTHGLLSAVITKILSYYIKIEVFSNIKSINIISNYKNFALSISLIVLAVCFICSIDKNNSGKFKDDMI